MITPANECSQLIIVKYLRYLIIAAIIDAVIYLALGAFFEWDRARDVAIVVSPLSLWAARLYVGIRRGKITRRMPMLDGGPTMKGVFWRFHPEIYVRSSGFDNFKGYVFKECLFCLLLWVMFLSAFIARPS